MTFTSSKTNTKHNLFQACYILIIGLYLKEKGGTTVAYALDGKDNVSCIDLDHC